MATKTFSLKSIFDKIILFIQTKTGLSAALSRDILWAIGLLFVIGLGLAIGPMIGSIAQNNAMGNLIAILITVGGYGYYWYSSDPDGYNAIISFVESNINND